MTKNPISTISFNTVDFLKGVCDDLLKREAIQSYFYIRHYAEKDTTKDHYHILLIPSRPVDPLSIRRLFVEPCIGNSDLGCLPFVKSKIGDWLLYAIHEPKYLLSKGLCRVNTYSLSDVVSNEPYYYLEHLHFDAMEKYSDSRLSLFLDRMRHGDSLGDILKSGLVPPSQIVFFEKTYNLNSSLIGSRLDANGNDTLDFVPF